MESTGTAKAEAESRAEAARIEGQGSVLQAKLKAEALAIETVSGGAAPGRVWPAVPGAERDTKGLMHSSVHILVVYTALCPLSSHLPERQMAIIPVFNVRKPMKAGVIASTDEGTEAWLKGPHASLSKRWHRQDSH